MVAWRNMSCTGRMGDTYTIPQSNETDRGDKSLSRQAALCDSWLDMVSSIAWPASEHSNGRLTNRESEPEHAKEINVVGNRVM